MKVLELFSGTHSIGVVCKERNYDVVSLDRDIGSSCKLNPEYVSENHIKTDILEWDYKTFEPGSFDIITASPVCTWWSLLRKCNYGRPIKPHTVPFCEELFLKDIDEHGKPMVDKVFEILDYFKPKYWWIENPKSSQMWRYIKETQPQYDNYKVFDYCKFSDFGYKKPTTFLSNIPNLKDVICNNDCPNMLEQGMHNNIASPYYAVIDGKKTIINNASKRKYCKQHKLRLDKVGGGNNRLERYRIPKPLIRHLFSYCN
jgi:site-specific DNA-cytosine methylase